MSHVTSPLRLVLVGGGHAHALVLRALAVRPEPRWQVTLVSPSRYATYSGMVPGAVAGIYRLADAQIDLDRLARRGGHALTLANAVAIDPGERWLRLSDGTRLRYDLASFDIGSEPTRPAALDPGAPLIELKPIDAAVQRLDAALTMPPPASGRRIIVVGAGAGGTEVALALAARLATEPQRSIILCGESAQPVVERGPRTAAIVATALAERRITFVGNVRAERVGTDAVEFDDGCHLDADLVVWATGAGGLRLFAESGLEVDGRGALHVTDALRCPTHPEIFAAGDCATLLPYPDLPKAGVFAVREAPILDHNLRAAARGTTLRRYRPQRRFLSLLNTCDGQAVLSYGRLAWRGRAAWRLKDWIDRRFVAQFRRA